VKKKLPGKRLTERKRPPEVVVAKPLTWQSYETIGIGLHNFGTATDPLGRTWRINFVGLKPEPKFTPEGELESVAATHPLWTIIAPSGEVYRPIEDNTEDAMTRRKANRNENQ
jgi:hypothetical protein